MDLEVALHIARVELMYGRRRCIENWLTALAEDRTFWSERIQEINDAHYLLLHQTLEERIRQCKQPHSARYT